MKICKGNVRDAVATVSAFVARYGTYIYNANGARIKEIDADMVFEAFTKAKDIVGGMDGWEIKELALFSKEMCKWMAEFYKLIEAGAPWPSSTTQAGVAYMVKRVAHQGKSCPTGHLPSCR